MASPKGGFVEEFQDVLPSGVDAEGKEVSLEAYMSLQYAENKAEIEDFLLPGQGLQYLIDEIRKGSSDCGGHELDGYVDAYLEWFKTKLPNDKSHEYLKSQELGTDPEYFVEHIAGVNCVSLDGYNGNNISAEEMKACTTLQCVVDRRSDAHDSIENLPPEPDDEDFERESNYFLTGLLERCGSWEDMYNMSVYPRRHGFDDVNPVDVSGFELGDRPFHPYCLEIYKRASLLRLGKLDLVALFDWWGKDNNNDDTPVYPVEQGGQWWEHYPGAEVLVAYPLHVEALSSLFKAAQRPHEYFNAENSPFTLEISTEGNGSDPFGSLPAELCDMVVASLGSKDIASLRLASRSFRHLPTTLWHDLMQKEMPWIWEAWSDRPYAFMACTTRTELEAHDEAVRTERRKAAELLSEQRAIREEIIARKDAEFHQPRPVQFLDRLHTDWYQLYCQLQKARKNIKGLQNRERIWKGIEFVIRRVTCPDEDLDVAREEHSAVFPYRV